MAGDTATAPEAGTASDGHGAAAESHVVTVGDDAQGATDTHATTEAHGGGEAHGGVFPPFDTSTFASQLLWLAITFAALYVLMSKVALPRIGDILEVRRDRIEGDLAEAERMRQKTDQAIASYEEALAAAKNKAQGIAENTRQKIKADIAAQRVAVEADLTKKVTAAEASIQQTKSEALANVDEIAAETAVALAGQLVGKVGIKAARDAVGKVVKG